MSKVAKEAFIADVKEKYLREDICMTELLTFVKPSMTMTMDECFSAYCELLNWSDNDAFLKVNEDDNFVEDITANKGYTYKEIFKN